MRRLRSFLATRPSQAILETLSNKFKFEEPPRHYFDLFKDIIKQKGNNTKHALKFINSQINDADADSLGVLRIYREVLENHLPTPDEVRRDYSKLDYILYFWGPLMKNLFVKTDVWSHCRNGHISSMYYDSYSCVREAISRSRLLNPSGFSKQLKQYPLVYAMFIYMPLYSVALFMSAVNLFNKLR